MYVPKPKKMKLCSGVGYIELQQYSYSLLFLSTLFLWLMLVWLLVSLRTNGMKG